MLITKLESVRIGIKITLRPLNLITGGRKRDIHQLGKSEDPEDQQAKWKSRFCRRTSKPRRQGKFSWSFSWSLFCESKNVQCVAGFLTRWMSFCFQDFKKTIKLTWLGVASDKPEAAFTPTTAIYYDHIISKPGISLLYKSKFTLMSSLILTYGVALLDVFN